VAKIGKGEQPAPDDGQRVEPADLGTIPTACAGRFVKLWDSHFDGLFAYAGRAEVEMVIRLLHVTIKQGHPTTATRGQGDGKPDRQRRLACAALAAGYRKAHSLLLRLFPGQLVKPGFDLLKFLL
jgi:hypothetical protein